ncbi:SRF-type transcription factor (DNA-binding and dimerization domain) domain-containing protein [Ditylenchus destructor]|uniref:Serum response factor homolog n=1 Tax=Ditylenchus destructor TaxID=166010 RepID=A0AAD4NER3_9BILA|nr:SRF-type transcription factor (DNA-binding and dimerization domain) domain-containing protein [Ditylenchus destructor]
MPRSVGVTPTKYRACSSASPPPSNNADSSILKLNFIKSEDDPSFENEETPEQFISNLQNAQLLEACSTQSDSAGPLSSMLMAKSLSPMLNGMRELTECSESTSKESTPQPMNPSQSNMLFSNGKSPPSNNLLPNGKKTKGRVKIKMEYIGNKLRRYTTFSKRKTGIMKKAHELSTLTGTQVMLLVASETGHVYAFATSKLKPMIASDQGKGLIQACLSTPDENFPDMGAVKTEFTFDAPQLPPQSLNCPPSGTNPRKRKIPQGQTLADGNDLIFEENGSKQTKRIRQDSDTVNSKLGQKKATFTHNSSGKQQESDLQRTLKEALKAAANQRQRQTGKKGSHQNHQQNALFSNGMLGSGSSGVAGQQFNPMGILPLMLQGIAAACGPSCSNPGLNSTPTPTSISTNHQPQKRNTANAFSSSSTSNSSSSKILYQMPQGVVYAPSNTDTSPG